MQLSPNTAATLEAAVRAHEARTSAEICVVLAARSGSYRDLALGLGLGVAWVLLTIMVLSPLEFAPVAAVVELPLVALAVGWAAHRSPRLLRALAGRARLQRQVEVASAAAFHQEEVHLTRERTGVLVYLSVLEGRAMVLADAAVEGLIPAARLRELPWGGLRTTEQALAGLEALAALLAEALPPTSDNPNELPDAPRLRAGGE